MSKYSKYVVTELKTPDFGAEAVRRYSEFATRILWMDKDTVPGAFQMNCAWYRKPLLHSGEPHQHDVDEILGFFGSDASKPYDLGGEIEIRLGDQKQTITSTAMVFIPAGMKHCIPTLRRVDRPIFHFSTVTGGQYVWKSVENDIKSELDSSRYIVTELKMPEDKKKIHQDYTKYATRVLWLDKDVVPGAYNMNTAWYLKAGETLENVPHTHDRDEIIGFFGNDYTKPHDLGGEVEIWLEDEKQVITRSAMIFVPAGMKHCPLILKRVDRPIFHFTVVIAGRYIKDEDLK